MYFEERRPPPEERGKALEEMKAYVTFDPTYHPGLIEEDLCHNLYDKPVKDSTGTREGHFAPSKYIGEPDSKLLCHNCGWSERDEKYTSYTSRVKVHHTKKNTAFWNIGTKWMLRDEPNDCTLGNDVQAMEFLHSKSTTIPIPRLVRLSEPTETFQFTLMTRVQGEPLYNVYHTYTTEQRQSIAKQLGSYIRQWRQFTAPRAQKVNGEQLHDILVGTCRGRIPECKRIGYTRNEWLEDLSPELRKGLTMEDKTLETDPHRLDQRLKELKDSFPDCDTYVFTHGDLNLSNIIVQHGIITGIIDWERAGFYPWWAERMFAHAIQDERFHELFDYIEDEFCPGYDSTTFIEKVSRPVCRVERVFERCPRLHRGKENAWFRQPFCICKPYSSHVKQEDMGVPPSHEIADADPRWTQEDFDEIFGK